MATISRLKKKKNVEQKIQEPQTTQQIKDQSSTSHLPQKKKKIFSNENHAAEKQKQYEMYYQLAQSNPSGVSFSNPLFPNSFNINRQFRMPLSIMVSPLLGLQTQSCPMLNKNIDKIPRCGNCRSFMNCYNEIKKKNFICFVCGRQNNLDSSYSEQNDEKDQLSSNIYQAPGSQNYYNSVPPESALIFLIDISPAAYQCKMIYYAVAAIKEVLQKQQFNDTAIYFYTFDEVLHQYDFSGLQTKRMIMDPTINKNIQITEANFLENIREKLFLLLDDLEQISQNNTKHGSNFFGCLKIAFDNVKQTGGKMFIFQSNEMMSGQAFTQQQVKQNNNPQHNLRNIYESKNKLFFDTFVSQMLKFSVSMSLFIFERSYKNLRVLTDVFKLTSSELKLYHKDNPEDLNKFYYDLSFLLNSTFCNDVRMELIVSPGWNFTAVYGNLYRIKQYITFKFCYLQSSRKVFICVSPQQNNGVMLLPYFCLQIITNYFYKRQHYISIATVVNPITGYVEKLYKDIDYQICSSVIYRTHLSSLRLDTAAMSKKKILEWTSDTWKCAVSFYKKKQNVPEQFMSFFMGILALLKSYHNQLQLIVNSTYMDKIVAERNELQGSGTSQLYTFWNPYLFNLSTMDETMCREDLEFIYPQTVDPRFNNIKEGMFLLDCGIAFYLYIGKQCSPELLKQLFGKNKKLKNEHLTEDHFIESFFSSQVSFLIKTLREQKSYGWVPLYIIRYEENSSNEKNFKMNFFAEKYEEFRNYRISLNEFITMLEQTQVF